MGEARKGKMKVSVEDSAGIILTKEYGFTVEEDQNGISFDYFDHPEYGKMLLLNQDIFFLKFWKTEDIKRLQRLINDATNEELIKRDVQ